MQPIVNGFEASYSAEVVFRQFNAQDGAAGQHAFEAAGLPGHPGYVLLRPDGAEHWRGFGAQPAAVLESALRESLQY